MNYDLDMDVDDQGWPLEHPVYCPVPWCTAHTLRRARCGDDAGNYVGIHVARIEYAKSEPARVRRQVRSLEEMGMQQPELTYGLLRLHQDAVDTGLLPAGRKGRRKLA